MDKKAAELSMNVIIIAALGLLVLVIIAVIFMGRAGQFSKGVGDVDTAAQKMLCQKPGTTNACIYNPNILECAKLDTVKTQLVPNKPEPLGWSDCTGSY